VNQFLPKISIYDSEWLAFDWRQINKSADLSYNVEYSHDLNKWFLIDDQIESFRSVLDSDTDRDSSAILNRTSVRKTTSDHLFLRLNVSAANN
jgi:hypothetical protein